MFRKLDLFTFSGEEKETPTLLGPVTEVSSSYGTQRSRLIPFMFAGCIEFRDRICGLVLRDPGYRSRGPGKSGKVVGLERGPLSLVSTIKELLGRKSSGSGLENR
jgi:hypothetical protein